MKIRLEGTLQEIDAAAKQLRLIFRVGSVSKPYKNRNSDLHRVYIEVEPIPPHQFSQDFYRKMHELCPSIDPVTGEVHKKENDHEK